MSLMYQPRTVWLSEVGEMAPLVGVVALQGGFAEHIEVSSRWGPILVGFVGALIFRVSTGLSYQAESRPLLTSS